MILGIDAHKRTHTVVAVDHHGKKVRHTTVAATSEGHLELLLRARGSSPSAGSPWRTLDTSHAGGSTTSLLRASTWCGCRPSSWLGPGAR